MALPRLEGLIRVDAATNVGTFGGSPVTLPAGEYFLGSALSPAASFLDALATAITTALGGSTTVTCDAATDAGTGKVTMSRGSPFAVTWSSTGIRDLLGYTGNLSSAASHESPNAARYLWMPTCGRSGLWSPESSSTSRYGKPESDLTVSVSPSGYTRRLAYSTRYVDSFEWRHIVGRRAWREHESVVNESLERFWLDCIGAGRPLRYYPDRATPSVYQDYVFEGGGDCLCRPNVDSWVGPHSQWTVGPYVARKWVR